MKTSNKLLIALLVFLPLVIILYNFLLKVEYVKGNIRPNGPAGTVVSNKLAMKPFRHVVYDGALWKTAANGNRRSYGQRHKLTLIIGTDSTSYVDSSPMLDRYLQVRQSGDTLFLSHEVKGQSEGDYAAENMLRVYVPELVSVSAERCELEIFPFMQRNTPLKMHLHESVTCTVQSATVPLLDLQLDAFTACTLNGGGRIDTLMYQMGPKASLNVSDKFRISALQAQGIDTSASISLTGNAVAMSHYLQTAQ